MKKLMFALLLGIFLLGFAGATLKSYEEDTQTITLSSNFLFVNTGDIASIQLMTPLINYVPDGDEVLVIKYNVTGKRALDEFFFGETKTYQKDEFDKGNRNELGKVFIWKYLETYQEEVPTYSSKTNLLNGTQQYSRIESGTEFVQKERWTLFDKRTPIGKDENIILGLFTDIHQGERIEFVPEFKEKEIEEWASIISTNGAITTEGDYQIITFTSDGWFNVNKTAEPYEEFEILVVAAGGGGGIRDGSNAGGGGGAGGVIYNSSASLDDGNYTIVIGAGVTSANGEDSSFGAGGFTMTAKGGGKGFFGVGLTGGSSGGNGNNVVTLVAPNQGSVNGIGYGNIGGTALSCAAGGGGGAGASGGNATGDGGGCASPDASGDGGDGIQNDINGTNMYYAGGGGGGVGGSDPGGAGGEGGGGDHGEDGINGTGGGAGGTPEGTSTIGGSGIVIIRYLPLIYPIPTLNSPADNYNQTNNSAINFSSTVTTANFDLNNVTLFIDDVGNETNLSGTEGSYFFTKIIADGTHTWNVQGCNIIKCTNETARTFTIDSTIPSVVVSSPIIENYLYQDYNLTLNFTPTDILLSQCVWVYNETNTTLPCSTGVSKIHYFDYSFGNNSGLLYVNDTLGNLNRETVSWIFKIGENSRTFNTTSYETANEIFSVNLTANTSLTAVTLNYNGTEYATTQSGTVYSTTLVVPTSVLDRTFRWKYTYAGSSIYSRYSYQNISVTNFSICDATLTTSFLNLSFKNEDDLTVINATLPTSTFTYYLGNGGVNKSYSLVNNSLNYQYTFCATPTSRTLNVLPYIQYKQGTSFPQRIWTPTIKTYNSALTNQTLYLLATANGIYVTFQVVNSGDQTISDVAITATRSISGSDVLVGAGTTGEDGSATFWLNPDFTHTFTFTKSGFTTYTTSFAPTQSSYTISLGSGTTTIDNYFQGMSYSLLPTNTSLTNDTTYAFGFKLDSSYWDLTSYGFNLRLANGTVISGGSTATSGTQLSLNYDTNDQAVIYMDYYWLVDGNYTNGTRDWVVYNTLNTQWSISYLFTDLKAYIDSGIFGLDDFGLKLIIFLIIFLSVGIMSYKYGLTNPILITFTLFSVVFALDVVFGIIPDLNLPNGSTVPFLLTFITGLIMVVAVLKEVNR